MDTPLNIADRDPATDSMATECFHCGLPISHSSDFVVKIDGQVRSMCCPGCQAVATAIVRGGHEDFYRHRTGKPLKPADPVPDFLRDPSVYDNSSVQESFVREDQAGFMEASLILQGITCAACVWLNERHLRSLPGVRDVQVNYCTHRAQIRWDPKVIQLSEILEAIQDIGYVPHPYDPKRHEQLAEAERKQQLKRIGVAGALGMQVMMIATALYFGDWSGIRQEYRVSFQWVSLALTVPILVYSAQPFFVGAWRDLKHLHPNMDVPVSLGIAIAFLGSTWATWTGNGQIYYESVAMFVFFLLSARYFELMARNRSVATLEAMTNSIPESATRLHSDGTQEIILASNLTVGDRLLVTPGTTIPADGVVVEGASSANESLVSGESQPVAKQQGDEVVAGSINLQNPLTVDVTRTPEDTCISNIVRLVEQAQTQKPRLVHVTERAAVWFIGAVLVLAVGVGIYWWQHAPDQWLMPVVSVLVITCPCALSLATPTALTAAIDALTRSGLIPVRAGAIETLPKASHFVFDKTGTLTEDQLFLESIQTFSTLPENQAMRIAASLAAASEHPIAKAICDAHPCTELKVGNLTQIAGAGLSGVINGKPYHMGTLDYVREHAHLRLDTNSNTFEALASQGKSGAWLADNDLIHAVFLFRDRLRDDAKSAISVLKAHGISVSLYSGDHAYAAQRIARLLRIDDYAANLSPADKLEKVTSLQASGKVVAMIGDGINDAPVLSAAQVSIAMGSGADLARTSADLILLNDQLDTVVQGLNVARKTQSIIRQNIAWGVGYNLLALPAAAVGMVPPWLAAIGMSLSSIIVVANALRITAQNGVSTGRQPTAAQVNAYA